MDPSKFPEDLFPLLDLLTSTLGPIHINLLSKYLLIIWSQPLYCEVWQKTILWGQRSGQQLIWRYFPVYEKETENPNSMWQSCWVMELDATPFCKQYTGQKVHGHRKSSGVLHKVLAKPRLTPHAQIEISQGWTQNPFKKLWAGEIPELTQYSYHPEWRDHIEVPGYSPQNPERAHIRRKTQIAL